MEAKAEPNLEPLTKEHRQHQSNYTTNSLEKITTQRREKQPRKSAFVVLETSTAQGANKMSFSVIILNHCTFRLLPTQAGFSAMYEPASPPQGILSKPCK
jgi:hypothetical protein